MSKITVFTFLMFVCFSVAAKAVCNINDISKLSHKAQKFHNYFKNLDFTEINQRCKTNVRIEILSSCYRGREKVDRSVVSIYLDDKKGLLVKDKFILDEYGISGYSTGFSSGVDIKKVQLSDDEFLGVSRYYKLTGFFNRKTIKRHFFSISNEDETVSSYKLKIRKGLFNSKTIKCKLD